MKITEASHPNLFSAFETISHDRGSGAGHKDYKIPDEYLDRLLVAEKALSTLAKNVDGENFSEFDTFCIGDYDAATAIASRSTDLETAHGVLNAFFDGFQ